MVENMKSIILDDLAKYKECAGKGCQNVGIHHLKVLCLNKLGWFCDHCRNGLISDGLVVDEIGSKKED